MITYCITRGDEFAPRQLVDEIIQLFPRVHATELTFKPLDEDELSLRIAEPMLRKTCFVFISMAIHISSGIKTVEDNYLRMVCSVIFPYVPAQGTFGTHFDDRFHQLIYQEKQQEEILQSIPSTNRFRRRKQSSRTQHINRFNPTNFDLRPDAIAPISMNIPAQIPVSVPVPVPSQQPQQQQQSKVLNISKEDQPKFLISHVRKFLEGKGKKCIKWKDIFEQFSEKFVNMDVETNLVTAFVNNLKEDKLTMGFELMIIPHGDYRDVTSYIQSNTVDALNTLRMEDWKYLIEQDFVWIWICNQDTSTRNYLDSVGQEFSKMFFPGSCLTVTPDDKLDGLYWRETLEQLLYVCDPKSFEVRESKLADIGNGLYAKDNLPKNTLLRIHGTISDVDPNENEEFEPNSFNFSYIDTETDDLVCETIICHSDSETTSRCITSYINDSRCEYNTSLSLFLNSTILRQDRFIKTTRNIVAGEELFVNYGSLYWELSAITPKTLAEPIRLN